ncbi:hypothetical protein BJX70DRAFT_407133 [Aspergillus crustosus]
MSLKRKALEALLQPPHGGRRIALVSETELEFHNKYGRDLVQRQDYHQILNSVVRLIREGAAGCGEDVNTDCAEMSLSIRVWASRYLSPDLELLSCEQLRTLIAKLDGFCVQMEWKELRLLLTPDVRTQFGLYVGELLIHLTVYEWLFQNPFWYLDGKDGPTDADEDPTFARKLGYLFDRLYKTNPTYAVLWRMQTQRLANSTDPEYTPDVEFGESNSKRLRAAASRFADRLLITEPFCWLLKDPGSSPQTGHCRDKLRDIFHKAIRAMINCETRTNGQPVLRGIDELGGVFRENSKHVTLTPYAFRPRLDLYNGQRIIFVSRPSLVYVDSIIAHDLITKTVATEVMGAQVMPEYVPEAAVREKDEIDVQEKAQQSAGDDKDEGTVDLPGC